jgi:hypothetical protein
MAPGGLVKLVMNLSGHALRLSAVDTTQRMQLVMVP